MTMLPNALRHIISLACVAGCLGSINWRSPDYDYQGVGCYAAQPNKVNFEIKAGEAPNMGPATCQQLCADYPFYAIHNSRWCYCGHDFARIGFTGRSHCTEKCQGRSRDYCGNEKNMMIYQNQYYENTWVDSRYFLCALMKEKKHFTSWAEHDRMSIQMCRDMCKNFPLFAMSKTNDCGCLDAYDDFNNVDITGACNSLCAGNKYQTCGGDNVWSVYVAKDAWPVCKDNQISSKNNRQACLDACAAQRNCKIIGYDPYTKKCILMETQCKPPAKVGKITLSLLPAKSVAQPTQPLVPAKPVYQPPQPLVPAKPGTKRTAVTFIIMESVQCAAEGLIPNVKPSVIPQDACDAVAMAQPSAKYYTWNKSLQICAVYTSCVLEDSKYYNYICGLDNNPQPTREKKGTITVYLNDGNQKPIPNIPITLINKAGAAVFDSKTAADGSVTINIAPGTYSLVPKFPEGKGPAPPNDVTEVIINPGQNNPLVTTFVLDSNVTVQVTLLDGNGIPLANIPVSIYDKDGQLAGQAFTDANGVLVTKLPPGQYVFKPVYPNDRQPANGNGEFEVTVPNGSFEPMEIKVPTVSPKPVDEKQTVTVTLLDGNGIPLANIPVSIYDKDGQLAGQAFTDANGVLVTKLPPGQYVFKPVYPNDRQPANGNGEFEVTVPNGNFEPMEIKVPTGIPKPDDELQTITVTLVDADGNALANIPVQIYDKDGNFVDVATTDDNGVLSVELPLGEYSLRPAFPPGLEPTEGDGLYHIILGPDNKTDFVIDTKVPSVVINGGGGADGDTSASINITVVDQNGNPIPAMEVGICQQDGKNIQTYMTDATGTFLLKIPAGKYVIVPDYSDYGQADIANGTFVVELKPGANQPYTFKAPVSLVTDTVPIDHNTDSIDNWPGQIKGTIYGDDNENNMFDAGEGIPGVDVKLLDDQNRVFAKVKTDSNGAYEFKDLVPGVYTVVIKPSSQIPTAGSQPITKKLNVQSNSTSRFDLRLLGTKTPTSGKLIVLAFVDANSNQQQDAGEAPIVAAPVILTSVDGQEVARGVTDQTGTATIEDVPFAIYSIKLDLTSHPEFGTPYVEGRIDMKTSTLRIAFSIQT